MENTGVQSDIVELAAVRRQTKIWQWGLFGILALTVAICLLVLNSAVRSLTSTGQKQDQFVKALGKSMQTVVLPSLQEVGAEAVKSIDFNKEMAQLNKRTPEVSNAAFKEARTLADNIPMKGNKLLNAQFATAMQEQEAALRKEFPDISEEQLKALMSNLANETTTQLRAVTDAVFSQHINAMNNMISDIAKIKTIEGPAAKQDMPTWDMSFMLIDIARADMAQVKAETTPATAPVVAPKAPAATTTKASKAGKGK